MKIQRSRLHGFPKGSPAYVVLHGLMKIAKGKALSAHYGDTRNPKIAFEEALEVLWTEEECFYDGMHPYYDTERARTHRELHHIVLSRRGARSIGDIHQSIHAHLSSRGYTDSHVNTISMPQFNKMLSPVSGAYYFFINRSLHYVVTARDPSGNMCLFF